jgi:uncharacterized membrane-anchored protein YitT (DUF2179 family)
MHISGRISTAPSAPVSAYRRGKQRYQWRVNFRNNLRSAIFILLGIVSATFGLRSFLLPSNFLDGGATGISLLISEVTTWPFSLLLILINLPFIGLAVRHVGRLFAIRAAGAIAGLALCVALLPMPVITTDKLLIAVFGGIFLGAGIGFSMRGGAVIDGTEVLAIYLSKKLGATIGDVILVFNIFIFSVAAYVINIETALYAVLTYFSASKTVDFIIEGIEEYTGVTIISVKHEELKRMITEKLGRGVTIYKGRGGYGKTGHSDYQTDILFTVVTRLEVAGLNAEIEKIDPHAFVVMGSIKDTRGGMIKKRPLH